MCRIHLYFSIPRTFLLFTWVCPSCFWNNSSNGAEWCWCEMVTAIKTQSNGLFRDVFSWLNKNQGTLKEPEWLSSSRTSNIKFLLVLRTVNWAGTFWCIFVYAATQILLVFLNSYCMAFQILILIAPLMTEPVACQYSSSCFENLPVDSCLLGPEWFCCEWGFTNKAAAGAMVQKWSEIQGYKWFGSNYLKFIQLFGLDWLVTVLMFMLVA